MRMNILNIDAIFIGMRQAIINWWYSVKWQTIETVWINYLKLNFNSFSFEAGPNMNFISPNCSLFFYDGSKQIRFLRRFNVHFETIHSQDIQLKYLWEKKKTMLNQLNKKTIHTFCNRIWRIRKITNICSGQFFAGSMPWKKKLWHLIRRVIHHF